MRWKTAASTTSSSSSLCDPIFNSRKNIFFQQLDHFNEGVLAGIFDCLDRVQHMFMRSNPEIVEQWYIRLDEFVGEVQSAHR